MDFSAWSPSHLIVAALGIRNDNRTSHRRVSTTESEHGTAAKARRDLRSCDGTARRSDRQAIRGSESTT